jgi:hypothetical protein
VMRECASIVTPPNDRDACLNEIYTRISRPRMRHTHVRPFSSVVHVTLISRLKASLCAGLFSQIDKKTHAMTQKKKTKLLTNTTTKSMQIKTNIIVWLMTR